jgi:hypothetical protein
MPLRIVARSGAFRVSASLGKEAIIDVDLTQDFSGNFTFDILICIQANRPN